MTLMNASEFSLEAVRQGRPSAAILTCQWVPATREAAFVSSCESSCEIKIVPEKIRGAQAPHGSSPTLQLLPLTSAF